MIPLTIKLVLTFFKLVLSPLSPPVGLLHSMFSLLLCLICCCLKIFCRVCPAYFNSLRGGVILGEGGMGRCAPWPDKQDKTRERKYNKATVRKKNCKKSYNKNLKIKKK